ncbi:MAG: DUF4405 domain-containing protein [Planctomycetota bacterium]|nr:MAG: DUF4405 domain-containing protein [Planctomycetota bacterium]REJ90577.1 MAG: DUF4405 domain-containing protein [Planctomycetota bacterium]
MSTSQLQNRPQPESLTASAPSRSSWKLSRTAVNFLLDTFLLLNFVTLLFTTVVVRFIFPLGAAAEGWRLWGLNLGGWLELQFATLAVMTAAVLLHVMLHWNWICGVVTSRLGGGQKHKKPVKDRDGIRTIYGVGLLIMILNVLGVALAIAALMIRSPLD